MAVKSTPRKGGKGRRISEVDLLEVSFTSRPMHAATRALSWKGVVDSGTPSPSAVELAEAWSRVDEEQKKVEQAAQKAAWRAKPIKVESFEC